MRKLAPAFILTTLVALSSGSALALGDMNKSKKAPTANSTAGATAAPEAGRAGESATAPAVNSNMPMANETVAVDSSRKSSAMDCQGIAATDPLYKTHNCGADKGRTGAVDASGASSSRLGK